MKRSVLVVAVLAVAGGGFAWLMRDGGDEGAAAGAAAAPARAVAALPVEAQAVTAEPLVHEIVAVGSLRSNESVVLSSEIAGRIAGVHFREGQPVAAGTLLFTIDDSVHRAELDQARANLSLAQRNHERAEELFGRKLIAARERDEAASRLEVDRAAVALAQARFAKTRILAPFPGVVGLRQISPGDYVTPGQPLAPLEQLSVLKADFRLSEAALSRLKVGQALSLEVDAYPGQTFAGRVYAIDPRLAEDTRSIGVRAQVPNDHGRLRPGLFARIRLIVAEKSAALMVPEQAIVPQGERLFVYVVQDGKAALRPVQVGLRVAGKAEILDGIVAGDTVITAGLQKLTPGAAVTFPAPGESAPAKS